MISRAANVFAAQLVRHRPATYKFSRGQFDVCLCILVIMHSSDGFGWCGRERVKTYHRWVFACVQDCKVTCNFLSIISYPSLTFMPVTELLLDIVVTYAVTEE